MPEYDITGAGHRMQILSITPPKAIALWRGQIGVELEMAGLGVARLRFVLLDDNDEALVRSEHVVLREGQAALLTAQVDGEDVGIDWIQELEFTAHSKVVLDHLARQIMERGMENGRDHDG